MYCITVKANKCNLHVSIKYCYFSFISAVVFPVHTFLKSHKNVLLRHTDTVFNILWTSLALVWYLAILQPIFLSWFLKSHAHTAYTQTVNMQNTTTQKQKLPPNIPISCEMLACQYHNSVQNVYSYITCNTYLYNNDFKKTRLTN